MGLGAAGTYLAGVRWVVMAEEGGRGDGGLLIYILQDRKNLL